MERKPYPSDLSDVQWALIEPMTTAWKQDRVARSATGDPGFCDLREVVNAIFYQNRTGCQWRYLPHDLPHGQQLGEVLGVQWQRHRPGAGQNPPHLIEAQHRPEHQRVPQRLLGAGVPYRGDPLVQHVLQVQQAQHRLRRLPPRCHCQARQAARQQPLRRHAG